MRNLPTIRRNSTTHQILLLLMDGPKSRGDLAEGAGVEKKIYKRDFEVDKANYEIARRSGYKGTPPRRTTTVYPSMSGFLNYMSRGYERSPWYSGKYDMNDKDSVKLFLEVEKPICPSTFSLSIMNSYKNGMTFHLSIFYENLFFSFSIFCIYNFLP